MPGSHALPTGPPLSAIERPRCQHCQARTNLAATAPGPTGYELRTQTVAISLHEPATNAAKYGSLSAASGRVEILWSLIADGRLSLRWIESGAPAATPPTHRGFGTRVMENMIGQLKGEVRFDWRDQGLACEIELPLA